MSEVAAGGTEAMLRDALARRGAALTVTPSPFEAVLGAALAAPLHPASARADQALVATLTGALAHRAATVQVVPTPFEVVSGGAEGSPSATSPPPPPLPPPPPPPPPPQAPRPTPPLSPAPAPALASTSPATAPSNPAPPSRARRWPLVLVGTAALIAVGVAAVSLTHSGDGRSSSDVSPTATSGEPVAATPSADPSTSATSGPSLPPLSTRPGPTTPVPPAADETGTWEVRFDDGGRVTVDGRAFDASVSPVEVALAPEASAIAFVDDPPAAFSVEIGDAAGDDRVTLTGALGGTAIDLAGLDPTELVLVVSYGERPAPDDGGVDASGCFALRALGVELCLRQAP